MSDAQGEPQGKKTSGGRLGTLFFIVFLDLLGFGIVIPQLGVYAVEFKAAPFLVGLLLSVYSLMQLLFAPLLGQLSDRHGRRPVLLYSIAGSAAGYILFGFSHTLLLLFIARIIDGISGANISTAQAYIADVTTEENRARGMGMIGAAFGLGFVLGPAIGGFVGGKWGNAGIGFTAAGLALLNLLMVALFLPESRKKSSEPARRQSVAVLGPQLRLPVVGLALVIFGVVTTAFSQMEGTFSVYIIHHFLSGGMVTLSGHLWEIEQVVGPAVAREASMKSAWVFVAVGVTSTVIQGGMIGPLRKRFGEPALVIAGCVLLVLGLGGIPFAPTYGWLFLPAVVMAAGSALVNPSMSALVSIFAPRARQGEVMGAYQAMGSLGRIIGPVLGGFLFSALGAASPYLAAAAMTLVAVFLSTVLRARALQGHAA